MTPSRHCEERSDEAISMGIGNCHASLAMTKGLEWQVRLVLTYDTKYN
ncbi:MAG TPA: hypothetical protein VIH69_04710 [Dehalococcoidia bacterium]